ncbi:MAG: hypothetical protein Q7J31_03775 [Syntrophales bacterium]|nr:hypothetical protein [Syntrophales bacterium]
METLAELSPETKRELISLIDHRIEERLKDQAPLPTREDFSELKSIVEELAQAALTVLPFSGVQAQGQ